MKKINLSARLFAISAVLFSTLGCAGNDSEIDGKAFEVVGGKLYVNKT